MKAYDFKVLLEPDETSDYVATCPSLPGCHSQGDTVDGALDNIREAIELCLEDMQAHGKCSARPNVVMATPRWNRGFIDEKFGRPMLAAQLACDLPS